MLLREKHILNFKQPIRKIFWNRSVHRHWFKITQLFGNPNIYKVYIENTNFVDNNNVPYVPMQLVSKDDLQKDPTSKYSYPV